jgi:hypothetical protein
LPVLAIPAITRQEKRNFHRLLFHQACLPFTVPVWNACVRIDTDVAMLVAFAAKRNTLAAEISG